MNILIMINAGTPGEELFSFEIIGYSGIEGLVGIPIPPNFNETLTPEGDTYGYGELIFRITYKGISNCNVTKIHLWQEVTNFGYVYNYSGLEEIIPPLGIFYLEGQEYEFLVGSEIWPPRFLIQSLINIRIYTEGEGDFFLSARLNSEIEELESWTTGLRTDSVISFVNLLPLIVGLVVIVKIRRK